jgi:hypothetical protein
LSQGRVAHDLMPVSHAFFHDGQGRAWQDRTWHCSMTASSPVSNLLFHPTSPLTPPVFCFFNNIGCLHSTLRLASLCCRLFHRHLLRTACWLTQYGCEGCRQVVVVVGRLFRPGRMQATHACPPAAPVPVHTIDSINKCDRFRLSGTRQPALASQPWGVCFGGLCFFVILRGLPGGRLGWREWDWSQFHEKVCWDNYLIHMEAV